MRRVRQLNGHAGTVSAAFAGGTADFGQDGEAGRDRSTAPKVERGSKASNICIYIEGECYTNILVCIYIYIICMYIHIIT